ncbi:hypothetical protein BZA05DRAFT_395369 [Tricharina praecox]|uniref:uncharacterized protein n=1 Tax=Tricharina praecox TaxID=43433 RepID=UPI002220CA40|nr:uncharacterized protein BZA05DRAFT_395369 [Tricharina praecox]KAI5854002.1 hypothetical protein BZA05DRAFT_395369 [Tricharina praecox]
MIHTITNDAVRELLPIGLAVCHDALLARLLRLARVVNNLGVGRALVARSKAHILLHRRVGSAAADSFPCSAGLAIRLDSLLRGSLGGRKAVRRGIRRGIRLQHLHLDLLCARRGRIRRLPGLAVRRGVERHPWDHQRWVLRGIVPLVLPVLRVVVAVAHVDRVLRVLGHIVVLRLGSGSGSGRGELAEEGGGQGRELVRFHYWRSSAGVEQGRRSW